MSFSDDIFNNYRLLNTFRILNNISEERFESEDAKKSFMVNFFNDLYIYLDIIDINKDFNILIYIIHKYWEG